VVTPQAATLQRLLGREGHPRLNGPDLSPGDDGSGHGAKADHRADQMVGEMSDRELAARGWLVEVALADPAQDVLADRQGGLC